MLLLSLIIQFFYGYLTPVVCYSLVFALASYFVVYPLFKCNKALLKLAKVENRLSSLQSMESEEEKFSSKVTFTMERVLRKNIGRLGIEAHIIIHINLKILAFFQKWREFDNTSELRTPVFVYRGGDFPHLLLSV